MNKFTKNNPRILKELKVVEPIIHKHSVRDALIRMYRDSWKQGYKSGYDEGYSDGFDDGEPHAEDDPVFQRNDRNAYNHMV